MFNYSYYCINPNIFKYTYRKLLHSIPIGLCIKNSVKQINKIYRGKVKLDFKIRSDDESIIVVEVYKFKF